MELLIAEARKRKDEDHKPDDRQKAVDTEDDRQDPSEETEGDKAANDGEEDQDPFEVAARNEPAVQAIDDHNPNLLQPRAAGSPDEGFDDAELPDVVDLDDIIEPGMDAEVLMFDLLAAGYGVRRRPAPRPEEERNEQQQLQNVQPENNDQMLEYIPLSWTILFGGARVPEIIVSCRLHETIVGGLDDEYIQSWIRNWVV
ncbi:hypothetical protein R1sor_004517 [Riccia sorocarpa]|uniref:Uncharacterized protein n=1 Tax=Riccia sorocarpa TaxID=122646 RepID=A0ABD3HL82_9MARC